MPVPDDFDFDHWAETVELKTKPAKAAPLQEFEKPQPEPEPEYDGIQALHDLVAANPGDPINWVISDRALVEFAKKLWEAAYDQGTEDLSQCCGCSGGASTPNPFKEIYESDD